jgi:transposase
VSQDVERISYREAARRLGVDRQTVSDLVDQLGISPEPHPSNGRGLGLSPEHVSAIRGVLEYAQRARMDPLQALTAPV